MGAGLSRPAACTPLSRPLPQPCTLKPLAVTMVPQPRESTLSVSKTINTNFNAVFSLPGRLAGEAPPRPPSAEGAAASTCLPARPPAPPLGRAPVTGVQVPHTAPTRGARGPLLAPRGALGPALPVGDAPPGAPSPRAGLGAPPTRALGGRTRSPPALT